MVPYAHPLHMNWFIHLICAPHWLHIDVQAALDGNGASTTSEWYGLYPSSYPSFQPTVKIWDNKGNGNGLPMVPYAHPLYIKWFIYFFMCSTLMCKQLWMGMEPQPLHNGMVCSPAVTQAFSRLSKSGTTRAMVTGCQWFHMPIHCI